MVEEKSRYIGILSISQKITAFKIGFIPRRKSLKATKYAGLRAFFP